MKIGSGNVLLSDSAKQLPEPYGITKYILITNLPLTNNATPLLTHYVFLALTNLYIDLYDKG